MNDLVETNKNELMAGEVGTGVMELTENMLLGTKAAIKDGNFWGAIKDIDGSSRMAVLQKAAPYRQLSNLQLN